MPSRRALFLTLAGVLTLSMSTPVHAASPYITYPAQPGPGGGKHVVFLTGDEEYRSEEGLPMLAKILSQRQGFKCTVLFALDPDGTINPDNNASVPGAEVLATAVRYVDPYAPAPYAFRGYRRGLTPDDHALGKVLPAGLPAPPAAKKK